MNLSLPAPAPRLRTFFALGLAAQLSLVVLIATGAYLGFLPTTLPGLPHADLVGHAVLIGPLAFFLDGVLDHRPLLRPVPWARLAPLLVIAVAGLEEYAQRFSARRDSSYSDFFADVIGIVAFSVLSKRVALAFG
ncbi:MAG: hypothetical protein U0359_33850 [Byssovorax sp.]